jgi:ribosomal protein S8
MTEEKRIKINKLLDLLTVKDREKAIIEINENDNKIVFDFLEKEGFLNISYDVEYQKILPTINEKSASLDLWYRNINKTWIINLFQINKMLNANWKQ